MSDGATINNTCTNCSEQDTITIAGKTFCANCGTPQTGANVASAGQAAAQVAPSLSTDAHPAATGAAAAPVAQQAQLSQKMPSSGSVASLYSVSAPASSDANSSPSVSPALKADQLHAALNASPSSSISKFATDDSAESDKGTSEIGSLEDKAGESVMSDETLDELAKTSNDPMPTDDQPAQTPSIPSPAAEPQPIEASKPLESSYKLDLSQSGSKTLPKAVSDIRAGQQPTPRVTAAQASPVAPVAPVVAAANPVTAAPASPAAAPVATSASTVSALTAPQPSATPSPLGVSTTPNQMPNVTPSPMPAPQPIAQPAVASVMDSAALAAASAPATPAAPAKGVRAGSVALSLAGLLLVGAYIWQVNYPNLALKVAGSKAGISANFPGYIPNGWKLSGNIQSSPGNISYNIANTKTDKSVAVTESKTSWDSQALAENYVAPKSDNYLALQSQGLTIYLYDGNQASWVNNGTWYRVEGANHGLSQDQIIKLATSL